MLKTPPAVKCRAIQLRAYQRQVLKYVPTTQVDRPAATKQRCGEVESGLFDLFAMMGATEEQLDFPVLYASAREV